MFSVLRGFDSHDAAELVYVSLGFIFIYKHKTDKRTKSCGSINVNMIEHLLHVFPFAVFMVMLINYICVYVRQLKPLSKKITIKSWSSGLTLTTILKKLVLTAGKR